MMRQGVNKRGEAISYSDSTATYAKHHTEVHSILKNRHIIANGGHVRRSRSVQPAERSNCCSSFTSRSKSKPSSSRTLLSRSHSQPHHGRSDDSLLMRTSTSISKGRSKQKEDERELLSRSRCNGSSNSSSTGSSGGHHDNPARNGERGRRCSQTRGREINRHLPAKEPHSLNRYSNFLRRGRSVNTRRTQSQPSAAPSLIRSLSPNRFLFSQQEQDDAPTSNECDFTRDGIPYTAFITKNSHESGQSSLTGEAAHEVRNKPRSKSLIRSAIRHLGLKKKTDVHLDKTNTTVSTMNTSDQASASESTPRWDPKQSILQKVGELEIIDSDSDEDGSCATRSEHDDSVRSSLNMDSTVPRKYDEVFHSHQHPMFQTTATVDDENDENYLSFTKRTEGKPAKRWGLVGKSIGRGRSLSVGRRKMKEESEAKANSKEKKAGRGEVAQDVQMRSGRSKSSLPDSDEEDSCATRSEHNESKYDEVFHSDQHPTFQTMAAAGDENDENYLSFTKRSEGKPAKRWGLVGKAIGRGRSLSVGRRKMKEESEARANSKEKKAGRGEVAQDVQMRSGRSKSLRQQLQMKESPEHPVQQETKQEQLAAKQHKLRSASVDGMNRLKTNKNNASQRGISVSRMPSKKKVNDLSTDQKPDFLPSPVKPRKKRVKCIACRKKLSKAKCIEHIDLYFCAASEDAGSCFTCAKCHCGLDKLVPGDLRVCNAQVISNSRGSSVQCGECAKAMWMSDPADSETEAKVAEEEQPRIITCASCKGDFSTYKGEIQVLGENTYHSACLRRESLKHSGQSSDPLLCRASSSLHEEATPAEAAEELPEKAVVKLSVQGSHGFDREYLSATFFKWPDKGPSLMKIKENEKIKRMDKFLLNDDSPLDLSCEIAFELDSSAFGNPNYSGHFSSNELSSSHKCSPRKMSVAMPIDLDMDEDGRISTDLVAELQWIGRSNAVAPEHFSSTLTLEPYPYEDSSVKKVLNQMWRFEHVGLYHEITFSCPFKSNAMSWEIVEGDELDLTECRFDVFIDQPEQQTPTEMPRYDPIKARDSPTTPQLTTSVIGCDWESRAEKLISDLDNLKDFDPSRVLSQSLPPRRSCVERRSSPSHSPSPLYRQHRIDPDRDEDNITNVSELLSVAKSGEHQGVSLPKILHINARKQSEDDITGLSLVQANGCTVVAEVSKSSLFASKVKCGSVVLAINGRPVRSPRHFLKMFKGHDDRVTITATDSPPIPGSIFSVVRKEKDANPDFGCLKADQEDTTDSLGISFKMVKGLVRVREVSANGIFANTEISPGDVCLMVDGVPATNLNTAVRALALARGVTSLLTFSLQKLWSNLMDLMISGEYTRHWRGSECELTADDKYRMSIQFDSISGMCFEEAPGMESIKSDLQQMNTIIERVMDMLTQSIKVCRGPSDSRNRDSSTCRSSRGLSVSADGSMKGRSDVYKRALIKLEEMKASDKLSTKDYIDAKHALASMAIQNSKS